MSASEPSYQILSRTAPPSGESHLTHQTQSPMPSRAHNDTPPGGRVLSETALVIKNIPFNMRRNDFYNTILELGLPKPFALNYHLDPTGIFRGMAFANYRNPAETKMALEMLSGFEIGGRRLKVEYKVLPPGEKEKVYASTTSLSDEEFAEWESRMKDFKVDGNATTLFFPSNLNSSQRRQLHELADRLQLGHVTEGEPGQRVFRVWKLEPGAESPAPPGRRTPRRKQERGRNVDNAANDVASITFRERGAYKTSNENLKNASNGFTVIRQPKGPDGGNGFTFPRSTLVTRKKGLDPSVLSFEARSSSTDSLPDAPADFAPTKKRLSVAAVEFVPNP